MEKDTFPRKPQTTNTSNLVPRCTQSSLWRSFSFLRNWFKSPFKRLLGPCVIQTDYWSSKSDNWWVNINFLCATLIELRRCNLPQNKEKFTQRQQHIWKMIFPPNNLGLWHFHFKKKEHLINQNYIFILLLQCASRMVYCENALHSYVDRFCVNMYYYQKKLYIIG